MDWHKKSSYDFSCSECKGSTLYEGYMLDEDLWLTVAKKDENLCIGCLERRLGRRLTPNDFQNIPYNFGFEGEVEQIPKSKRLRERLGV